MVDPSITGQHGFVSVTRITGRGAVLMVVPENGTDFQAYRPASAPRQPTPPCCGALEATVAVLPSSQQSSVFTVEQQRRTAIVCCHTP